MRRARLKRTRFVVGGLAAAAVLVLLLPPVQTTLVRAVAGGLEGVELELDRVWAGPWGADIRGLRLAAPGFEVEVPHATADLAFWASLGRLRLDVEDASAEGLVVRIGRLPGGSGSEAEPVPFNGLARLARLPRRVVVRQASAEGSLELALSDSFAVRGPWSLSAADIGAGRRPQGTLAAVLSALRDDREVALRNRSFLQIIETCGQPTLRELAREFRQGVAGNKALTVFNHPIVSRPEILNSKIGPDELHLYTNPNGEHDDFLQCVRSRKDPYFPVDIGHRVSTVCHLANIARWVGRKLRWDPEQERFPDDDEANAFLSRPQREGYRLPDTVA